MAEPPRLTVVPSPRSQQLEAAVMSMQVRVVVPGRYWAHPCPACAGTIGIQWTSELHLALGLACVCATPAPMLAEALGLPPHVLEEPRPAAIAPVWLEDFLLEDLPAQRWLLAPYIQAETVCVIFSAPNVGKTLLALYQLCQIAMRGKVLALEAEGSRAAFQRRLGRAAAAVGGVPSRHFATLHINILSLLEPKHEAVIAGWAKGYDCTMLDSLGMFTAGVDENDVVGMSLVGAALRRIRAASGGTLLPLHHSIKAAWKPGEVPSLANLRGHSALAAMVDTALALVPAEAEDGKVGFELHVVKQRDGERVKPRRYVVDMRGDTALVEVEELEQGVAGIRAALIQAVPAFPCTTSGNQLCDAVHGKRSTKLEQIRLLLEENIIRQVGKWKLQKVVP